MWAAIAKLWITVSLMLETINSGTRTVHNLVSTAEEHSRNFKEVSLIELAAKKTRTEREAAASVN
jgi:hypothetical protein